MKRLASQRITTGQRRYHEFERSYKRSLHTEDVVVFCQDGAFYGVLGDAAEWMHTVLGLRYCGDGRGIHTRVGIRTGCNASETIARIAGLGKYCVVVTQEEDDGMKRRRLTASPGTSKTVLRSVERVDTVSMVEGTPVVAVFGTSTERAATVWFNGTITSQVFRGKDAQESLLSFLLRTPTREVLAPRRAAPWIEEMARVLPSSVFLRRIPMGKVEGEDGIEAVARTAMHGWLQTLGVSPPSLGGGNVPVEVPSMAMDARTVLALGLTATAGRGVTLLEALNRCRTPGGTRLLQQRLCRPSTDRATIEAWLDTAAEYAEWPLLSALHRAIPPIDLHQTMRSFEPAALDMDRHVLPTESSLHRWRGRLTLVADRLASLEQLASWCAAEPLVPRGCDALAAALPSIRTVWKGIQRFLTKETDAFSVPYHEATQAWIAAVAQANPSSPDVGGIELVRVRGEAQYSVPKALWDRKLPPTSILTSSTQSVRRYVDDALRALSSDDAEERFRRRCAECGEIRDLVGQVAEAPLFRAQPSLADTLALVDFWTSVGIIIHEAGLCRPTFVDEGAPWSIVDARVPDKMMATAAGQRAIGHTGDWGDDDRIVLLTGPNGSGKSTTMRALGLNQVLAQCGIGCFAASWQSSVVDMLGLRFGTSDSVFQATSAFESELRHADLLCRTVTARSLVLIDEFGQSTDAASGARLCAALLRFLYSRGCKAVFATHHASLASLPCVAPHRMATNDASGSLDGYYTHRMVPGRATSSNALWIASKLGIPQSIICDARAYRNSND